MFDKNFCECDVTIKLRGVLAEIPSSVYDPATGEGDEEELRECVEHALGKGFKLLCEKFDEPEIEVGKIADTEEGKAVYF